TVKNEIPVSTPPMESAQSVANSSASQSSTADLSKKETPSVQPKTDRPIQKPAADGKPSEKKSSEKKTEVASVKQDTKPSRPSEAPSSPAPSPVEPKTEPQREAAVVPPGVETQPLRPDQIERERILAIVKRQEEAFESKNVELFMADLAKADNEQRKEINKVFEEYARIDVSFEVQELNLGSDSATLKMIQSTRLVFKRARPDQKTKTKVLWELGKVENNWKIRDTKVLEKLP
ncbi:MAG: hypothetical protein HY349_08175, partial [Nitrospirae bacterium]|nr:hypothetical protein [Nitrospirota bacterium]